MFLIATLVIHLMAIIPIYSVIVGLLGYFCFYPYTPIINNASISTLVHRSYIVRSRFFDLKNAKVPCIVVWFQISVQFHKCPPPIPGGSAGILGGISLSCSQMSWASQSIKNFGPYPLKVTSACPSLRVTTKGTPTFLNASQGCPRVRNIF